MAGVAAVSEASVSTEVMPELSEANKQENDPHDHNATNPSKNDGSSMRNLTCNERGGDVNMEAAIMAEDVVRAGGFGARDDIGSFLPVAMDSTDFEASLRDAREFEEEHVAIPRPGLGWN